MANEAIFVAIGISCVVAVLLFIVFIIYCVKKQQDKEQTRQRRQRRANEERHRRHLMRGNIVCPPPYDPTNRQTLIPVRDTQIPASPPPDYKEVATPLPRFRNNLDFGDTHHAPYNGYLYESENVQTISRNVAPVNTVLTGNNYLYSQPSVPSSSVQNSGNRDRYVNRTTITTIINSHSNDNTFQSRPIHVDTEIVESTPRSSNSASDDNLSPRNNGQRNSDTFNRSNEQTNQNISSRNKGQTNSIIYSLTSSGPTNSTESPRNNGQRYSHRSPKQELDVSALIREQSSDTRLPTNTLSLSNRGERSVYDFSGHRQAKRQILNATNRHIDRRQSYQGTSLTEITNIGGFPTDRSNNSSYILSASYSGTSIARTPGKVFDSSILEVTPRQNSNNSYQSASTNQTAKHEDWVSGFEELSLI